MKAKVAQLIASLVIYFLFGLLMVFIAYGDISGNWVLIGIWTICMALAHTFIMEPFRARMIAKRNEPKQ
jgi:1,4-dihydroxy-2-naphthoate octaprenyltransferase